MPEEAASSCPVDELEARFAAAGHTVVVEPKIVPKQRTRSEAIRTARTNAERLAAWWDSLGALAPRPVDRERLLDMLPLLEAEIAGAEVPDQEAAA